MKRVLIVFSFFIILLVLLVKIFTYLGKEANKLNENYNLLKQEYQKEVGATIVILKDTFMIVDYNISQKIFVLSNGTKISKEFIDQLRKNEGQ